MIKFILPLLMMVMPVVAQDSPVIAPFGDFSGGINNYNPAHYLQPNESPNALNIEVDNPLGVLKQRSGYLSCGTTPSGNTATSMYEYSKSDGSNRLILSDNVSVWETFDCITFSTITTGLSANSAPYFKTVRDNLWIVNGSTYPIVWNGTTATQLDGVSDRPLAPIANYIEFWKERVWLGRVSSDPSSVYFTDLTDDAGNILDPATSTAAWSNALNVIYFGREAGSPIYGIKAYRDNLYVFKSNGIWRLIFESDLDVSVTKTVTDIGCKFQDTIVEMDDGFLYFVGLDGIYAFDGVNAKRISDKVQNTFSMLKQPARLDKYQLWDTPSDWLTYGKLTNVSTSVVVGSLALDYSTIPVKALLDDFTDGEYGSNPTWVFDNGRAGNNSFGFASNQLRYGGGSSVGANAHGSLYTSTTTGTSGTWTTYFGYDATNADVYWEWHFIADSPNYYSSNGYKIRYSNDGSNIHLNLYRMDNGTAVGLSSVTCSNVSPTTFTIERSTGVFTISSPIMTAPITYTDDIHNSSSYQILYGEVAISAGGTGRVYWDDLYVPIFAYKTAGFYESQISTFSNLTQWGSFGVDETLNGQSISYQIKTATSAYNIANTATYATISPGAIISNTDTAKYVRWASSFTTTNVGVTPSLNAVTLNYQEGDTSVSRLVARSYKNRYWMSGSTTPANDYNDMIMVKTKSPLNSWMLYDLPISAMSLWNGNLYGSISNSGVIARLDYGDNDGGNAIHSYWETRDEVFGSPINFKAVDQAIIDYAKGTNDSVKVSMSFNNGETWSDRSLNTTISKYTRNTKILNYDQPQSLQYRAKIENSKLDFNYEIYGLYMLGKKLNYYGK